MPYRRTAVVDDRLAAARERLITAATDLVARAGWSGASVTAVAAAAEMSVGSVYQHFPSKSALVSEVFRRAAAREMALIRAVAALPVTTELLAAADLLAPADLLGTSDLLGLAELPEGLMPDMSPAGPVPASAPPCPGMVPAALASGPDPTRAAADPVDRLMLATALFTRRALARRGLAYALLVAPSDPAVEAERLVFRRLYRDVFAALVEEGVEAGMLPAQDTAVAAAALTGAIGEVLVGPISMTEDLPRGGREAERVVREVVAMALRCVGAGPMARGWGIAEGGDGGGAQGVG